MKDLDWRCLAFAQMPPRLLYGALALRSRVFVLEQQCTYLDADDEDLDAHQVLGILRRAGAAADDAASAASAASAAGAAGAAALDVLATARILRPGTRFEEASIGRVCTSPAYRRQGLGRELMYFAIRSARELHPGQAIRISAQAYLRDFYASLGFVPVSGHYLEDGIEHLEMRLPGLAGPR